MVQHDSITSANERLARQINQEARQDPNSPYAGKLVGIANGCTFRELVRHLPPPTEIVEGVVLTEELNSGCRA